VHALETRDEKSPEPQLRQKRWGDDGYAMEELVAQLGAAFVCAALKLTPSQQLAVWAARRGRLPPSLLLDSITKVLGSREFGHPF
jgi:hypothetical protein